MLRELVAATKKNLTRLLRLRVSAAAILLGPLLLIVIVGLAFANSSLHDITVGAYADEHTDYVNNILANLQANSSTFLVVEYEQEQDCINSVKEGESHICATFKKKIDDTMQVTFHVDYSRLSLVLILINAMNQQVSNEASNIGADISKSILEQLQSVNDYVEENDGRLGNLSQESESMLQGIRKMRTDVAKLDVTNPIDAQALADIGTQADAQKAAITKMKWMLKICLLILMIRALLNKNLQRSQGLNAR